MYEKKETLKTHLSHGGESRRLRFCRLELDLDSALLMHFLYKDDEKQNTRRGGNRKMTKR